MFYSFAVNDANISPFKWKLARVDGGFLCVQGGVFLCDFFSLDWPRAFSRLTSHADISRTNKQEKKTVKKQQQQQKKNSYASLTEFYPITSTPYYSLSNAWIGLNFIRILRVVISPSVTSLLRGEKDSKQSDEIQATATQAVAM